MEKITTIEGVKKIYGSHNRLGMDAGILDEVREAVRYLRERDVMKHGTGVHIFLSFSVQF